MRPRILLLLSLAILPGRAWASSDTDQPGADPDAAPEDAAPGDAAPGDGDTAPEGPLAPEGTVAPPSVDAQRRALAGEAPAEEGEDIDTIVVYGEWRVGHARNQVARALESEGFDERIRRDGYTVFRHDQAWKGEVLVFDDGRVRHKRQPVQIGPTAGRSWLPCLLIVTGCIRAGGQTVSKRKLRAQRREVLTSVEPLVDTWVDRIADLRTDENLASLPERLDALWTEGTPLDPGEPRLSTPAARRQALLDYWDSRTDTVWGRRMQAAVEVFLREVVQYSAHPFTDDELRAFEARRRSARPLDLDRPWEAVMADLEARGGE